MGKGFHAGLSEKMLEDGKRPLLKHFGIALLFAWHYNLWFTPTVFVDVALLSDFVTVGWLLDLCGAVAGLLAIPILLGRKRHLSRHRWLHTMATAVAALGTLYLTLFGFDPAPPVSYAAAWLLGFSSVVLWIFWGELYTCLKAGFPLDSMGIVMGATMLCSALIALLLPRPLASFYVSMLPVVAGALFSILSSTQKDAAFPPLLPKSASRRALKPIIAVCALSLLAAMACYFLVAIIPWEELPMGDASFTIGTMGGAVLLIVIGIAFVISRRRLNIFKMLPWFIVLIIMALALFEADPSYGFAAFFLALTVISTLEVVLVMYFGILTSKGYISAALAFGFAGAFVRMGIALGNTQALVYEYSPALFGEYTSETILTYVVVLSAVIILLVRQEYAIAKLTSEPAKETDLERRCVEIAQEFKLSAREAEILMLIARGFTTDNIAKQLVISPYTVNTHIRHTYEKVGIHKRSELIAYINLQQDASAR